MITASGVASDPFVTLVESSADVNGRYQQPKALRPWSKDGYFSLLFKATDMTTGNDVALKFFDPRHNTDIYRRQCFSREPILLYEFIGRDNIVQLIEGEQTFNVPVTSASGVPVPFPMSYFVTELAPGSLKDYIYSNQNNARDSLILFRDIWLWNCSAEWAMKQKTILERTSFH